MNLSELCIRRPVMTVLLSASAVVAGILAYDGMPIAALPSYDSPTISVSADLPGASPETMASSVATPLERQFSTISGLSVISSTSILGNTSITLEFDLDRALGLLGGGLGQPFQRHRAGFRRRVDMGYHQFLRLRLGKGQHPGERGAAGLRRERNHRRHAEGRPGAG